MRPFGRHIGLGYWPCLAAVELNREQHASGFSFISHMRFGKQDVAFLYMRASDWSVTAIILWFLRLHYAASSPSMSG